ncbi:tyrosine recombinase XerC [Komagataeibacter europaeus]|uniref:Tyrosine recombinase XerC n=1 Tax=Komagataeibacter europaeus TaxID=33995 RepID=A0A0M0EKT0_KOMEU|nr:tyrosine recombinase XerC [Komagataeibacter europaeus]
MTCLGRRVLGNRCGHRPLNGRSATGNCRHPDHIGRDRHAHEPSRPRTLTWHTPGGNATRALEEGAANGFLYTSGTTGRPFANFSSNHAQIMRRILRDNPLFRRFGVHGLRHAFAVRWLKAGGNIYRLSRHLGHSSVKVTEQNYLGFLTVEEQERVQFQAEQIFAAPTTISTTAA